MARLHNATSEPAVRRLLLLSAAAFGAFALVYLLSVHTELGQRADEAALAGGRAVPHAAVDAADRMLRVVSIGTLVVAIAVLSALAVLRRRAGLLLIPIAVIGVSLVANELFKTILLPRPDLAFSSILENSYPSGHTSVFTSIGMAAVLVAPARLRLAVAVLAAVAAGAAGVFVVTADWHRPSDPIGSYLLCLSVAAACMAALRAWRPEDRTGTHRLEAGGPEPEQLARLEILALAAGAALFAGAVILASVRYGAAVDWNRLHAAYLVSVAAIFAAAGLTFSALLRGLAPPTARRSDTVLAAQPVPARDHGERGLR